MSLELCVVVYAVTGKHCWRVEQDYKLQPWLFLGVSLQHAYTEPSHLSSSVWGLTSGRI